MDSSYMFTDGCRCMRSLGTPWGCSGCGVPGVSCKQYTAILVAFISCIYSLQCSNTRNVRLS